MKALLHSIRELFNVPKLHEENARLQAQVEKLQSELQRNALAAPTPFYAVAKDFDASFLAGKVEQQVVDDLTPFLTTEAIMFLKQVFASQDWLKSRNYMGRVASMGISKSYPYPMFRVEFRAEAAGTTVEVY